MRRPAQPLVEKPVTTVGVEWQPSRGTRHWMCFNDLEVQLLAEGLTTDRIKQQAQHVAKAITPEAG